MKAFHGYITERLLSQAPVGASGFSRRDNNVRVLLNCWMEPGDKCTFVTSEDDLCIPESLRMGRVSKQLVCWTLPGHLEISGEVVWTAEEAAEHIAANYFSNCREAKEIIAELGERPSASPDMVAAIVAEVLKQI